MVSEGLWTARRNALKKGVIMLKNDTIYEGWNFNSGNYLFTTDTK